MRVDALKVTSRTSAFQFKGSNIGIPAIAKELKVRHVLEGSVRKSGETLRITAQLIDAQYDKHLWSETYDRPLTTENIFAIQDEIANAIVKALSEKLGLVDVENVTVIAVTENLPAYELYLKAIPLFLARKDLDKAEQYLIQALEFDPEFAKAWEMRTALQSLLVLYGYTDNSNEQADLLTEEFAAKALEIEPQSAMAKASLALIRLSASQQLRSNYNWSQIIALFNEAIAIDPNSAITYNWRGLAYQSVGKLDESINDYKRCIELEPLDASCSINYLYTIQQKGDAQLAIQLLLEGLNKNISYLGQADLPWLAKNKLEFLFKFFVNQNEFLDGWRRTDELYQAYLQPHQDHRELIDNIIMFVEKNTKATEIELSSFLIPLVHMNSNHYPLFCGVQIINATDNRPSSKLIWLNRGSINIG